ncbi:hypothetical protein ABLE91_07230 [Aquabacter sp. CN5-332]|uniref:hypothetical protein n=1 Tax=Aquabacter sp. CN5-332 TaxID=3156608 RepID=UPI0032B433C7
MGTLHCKVATLPFELDGQEGPQPVRRRGALDAARTPGPMIEEHPGARERDEEAPLMPAMEERKPH